MFKQIIVKFVFSLCISLSGLELLYADDEGVLVAIVDDGFALDHPDLAPFLWRNPDEIAGNDRDDDGNGYVDDVNGWDVADDDADVVPHADLLEHYYHGTYVSSVLLNAIKQNTNGLPIKILPIKAVSDRAARPHVRFGFEGIEYAMAMGAEVILCAFSGPEITVEQKALLREAHRRNIVIIGAAGNYLTEHKLYPAAHPTVLAVAALDAANRKIDLSTWAKWIDIAAPGDQVLGATTSAARSVQARSGTSPAAAHVAAIVALIKSRAPEMSNDELEKFIKASALPIEKQNPRYAGFLGAGRIQWPDQVMARRSPLVHQPEGIVELDSQFSTVEIDLEQEYAGLNLGVRQGDLTGTLRIYQAGGDGALLSSFAVADFNAPIFLPTTKVKLVLETDQPAPLELWFEAEGIVQRSRFCSGEVSITSPGELTDGSGIESYAAGSSCKWLITAPEGQRVRFRFDHFNTQARIDQLMFFNGAATNQTIMAIFTGREAPPEFISWRNQVLVWFVSDDTIQGDGFSGYFDFVPN